MKRYNLYEFEYADIGSESEIRLRVVQNKYITISSLKSIRIFNARNRPLQIQIDGLVLQSSLYVFNSTSLLLELNNLSLDMNKDHFIRLRFSL